MSRCGRCKGRGKVSDLRSIERLECPACEGTGIKQPKSGFKSRPGATNEEHDQRRLPIGPCVFCGKAGTERHHIVPVQRLRRWVKPVNGQQVRAIRDLRNQLDTCRPCHEAIENGTTRVEAESLPLDFDGFVEQYGVFGALPRHLQEAEAA